VSFAIERRGELGDFPGECSCGKLVVRELGFDSFELGLNTGELTLEG
jgi:hypothetical protein